MGGWASGAGVCEEGQSSEVNVTTNMQTLTHTKLPLFVRVFVCVRSRVELFKLSYYFICRFWLLSFVLPRCACLLLLLL